MSQDLLVNYTDGLWTANGEFVESWIDGQRQFPPICKVYGWGTWSRKKTEVRPNAYVLAAAPAMHQALHEAELAIEILHAAIAGHHATNLCDSALLMSIANDQLPRLSIIRAAVGKAEGRPR